VRKFLQNSGCVRVMERYREGIHFSVNEDESVRVREKGAR
jgi:hypothetical protein